MYPNHFASVAAVLLLLSCGGVSSSDVACEMSACADSTAPASTPPAPGSAPVGAPPIVVPSRDPGPIADAGSHPPPSSAADAGARVDAGAPPQDAGTDAGVGSNTGGSSCQAESNPQFCARLGAACGSISASDNCGGWRSVSCGSCPQGQTCGGGGTANKCGSACPANSTLNSQGQCECNQGHVPNQAANACLQLGGPCAGVSTTGYCADGATWVWCDPNHGLLHLPCGAGGCTTSNSATGAGSCTCGGTGTAYPQLDSRGYCTGVTGGSANELELLCHQGHVYSINCPWATGLTTGFCGTFVTSFGWQSMCFCSACNNFNGTSCEPLCNYGGTCASTSSGTTFVCQ